LIVLKDKNFYQIYLKQKTNDLNEVIVPSINPALAILKKTIKNKNNNNPQKKLGNFEFKAYNKIIVTANPDSIKGQIDTIHNKALWDKTYAQVDSSDYKFKNVIKTQHLFQTEKVSLYQFGNSKLKENILGTKMAGFKQPIYEIIAFNLQSFSIYDPSYELFETKYNSPIANDALTDYNYKLLDTLTINGRNTFMVHFKNKQKRKAAGLEGVLYIDQENFAIAKAVMRIKGVLDISGTHEFQYIPEENIWFPVRKIFKIVKGKNDDDIKILGGTIQFDGDVEKNFKPRKRTATDYIYLLSQTNNFDLHYNIPITIKNPSIAVEITDEAVNRPDAFWNAYRKDSLDIRSQKTYLVLDSIAVKKRIESRIRFGRKVINGFIPFGPVDIDLRKFLSYNNYEGLRIGAGGITNEQFSRKYKIEGYSAYGPRDDAFKYSLGVGARVAKFSNTWISTFYTDDIRENAMTLYGIDRKAYKIYDPRSINFSTFYRYLTWKTIVETKFIPKTDGLAEFSHSFIEPKFNYTYNLNGTLYKNYTMTTAMVSIRWNPFSDYMQTPTGRIETEKRFPKFTFQYTQSIPNVWDNDFKFSKFDFRTEYEIKLLNGQKTNLLFEAGYASGDVPLTHLYSTSPNNLTKDNVFQRITFAGKNSFETMYFNEFFSSEFISFQFKHGFNRITIFKKVKPSLVLVSRMAWGDMKKPEQHMGMEYKTLNNGFFESGIELNQIFNGLGLGGYYRYGTNHLSKFEDNIAIKLSYILDLGL